MSAGEVVQGRATSPRDALALAAGALAIAGELVVAWTIESVERESPADYALTAIGLVLPALGAVGFFLGLAHFQRDARARLAELAAWVGATAVAGPWLYLVWGVLLFAITGA